MSNLVRWNPIREMARMQSMMDRMFDETWRPWADENGLEGNLLALDVHEDDNTYTVTTALPGVNPDDIHVTMEDGFLNIEGEIPEHEIEHEGTRPLLRERRYGKYSRRIRLPNLVDAGKVDANYNNGVLTLTLPKAEEIKPKAIPVKVGTK